MGSHRLRRAALVSSGIYDLTVLLRGQQGTDHAIGAAEAGNRMVVLDDRVASTAVPAEWLGDTLGLRVFAGAADAEGVALTLPVGMEPVLPLAPVHLRAERAPGSPDIMLTWIRRSRSDSNGWGVVEAPVEHAPEAYVVTIFDGTSVVRTIAATAPGTTYTAAQQVADFGAAPDAFGFTVAQVSAVVGVGHAATGTFSG